MEFLIGTTVFGLTKSTRETSRTPQPFSVMGTINSRTDSTRPR